MRGIHLGWTYDEFKAASMPPEPDGAPVRTLCSSGDFRGELICEVYSGPATPMFGHGLPVTVGAAKGSLIVFFSGDTEDKPRVSGIRIVANADQRIAVLDQLQQAYGLAQQQIKEDPKIKTDRTHFARLTWRFANAKILYVAEWDSYGFTLGVLYQERELTRLKDKRSGGMPAEIRDEPGAAR